MTRNPGRIRRAFFLAALIASAGPITTATSSAADGPAEAPENPVAAALWSIPRSIKGMQNHITNARMRMRLGLTGVTAGPARDQAKGQQEAPRPSTPALECCTDNLKALSRQVHRIVESVDRLNVHYAGQGNTEAVRNLADVRAGLEAVATALQQFQRADTKGRAMAAMDGLIRPFNAMREAAERLAECCPLDPG